MEQWQLDHAASGDRLRYFTGDGWEAIVYLSDGQWMVRQQGELRVGADGREPTVERARLRALMVLQAMRQDLAAR